MIDGELLGDHAAKRQTEHDSGADTDVVKHGDDVIGHVGERVLVAVCGDRRQPGITIVHPDHEEPPVDERHAERLGIDEELVSHTGQTDDDRVVLDAERFVVQLDRIVHHGGHGPTLGSAL